MNRQTVTKWCHELKVGRSDFRGKERYNKKIEEKLLSCGYI